MATFAFIHGAGDVGWYWHLVEAELRSRGHDTVAPDLPTEDENAGLVEYADVVAEALGDRSDVVVVGQSFGGYVAPIVADRVDARLIVLVAAMIPLPGESAEEMFANTRWEPEHLEDSSTRSVFYHDVPPELADEAVGRGRSQSDTPGTEPWPLDAWPDVETRFVLCRNDRFFPARWLRPVVRDRLGIDPAEIDSGHCPALGHPRELAGLLDRYANEASGDGVIREDYHRPAMRNAALERLDGLTGDWKMTMSGAWFLDSLETEHGGTATVGWLGDAFLEIRATFGMDQADWYWVIGRSDPREQFVLLYHDERGVSRVFDMTFADGQWTLVREDPDFHQRFIATVGADRIVGRWEASEDFGATWRKDFDLTFERLG